VREARQAMAQQSFSFLEERLPRALNYFGSKYSIAHKYPEPRHDRIIEPFAGGAAYSLLYFERDVTLIDKSARVVQAWRCLIDRSPQEILDLPLLKGECRISNIDLPEDARSLVGFWLRRGIGAACDLYSDRGRWVSPWCSDVRASLARIASKINHWNVVHGSYETAPEVAATWFIDPPYQGCMSGSYTHYRVDHAGLAKWVRSRMGQTIACDRVTATWLPFRPLCTYSGSRGSYTEGLWTSTSDEG